MSNVTKFWASEHYGDAIAELLRQKLSSNPLVFQGWRCRHGWHKFLVVGNLGDGHRHDDVEACVRCGFVEKKTLPFDPDFGPWKHRIGYIDPSKLEAT